MAQPEMEGDPPFKLLSKNAMDNRYMPLDAKSWKEAYLRLAPWISVNLMAIVCGGLMAIYLLMVQTVQDTDTRDMYFDYRITSAANNYYHRNFVNAEYCCNQDPVVYHYTCNERQAQVYSGGPNLGPTCQPLVQMQCPGIASVACNATREALYAAAGLALDGSYISCTQSGRVRVGAAESPSGRPITLVTRWNSSIVSEQLIINDPFNINTTAVQAYVNLIAAKYSDPGFVQPSHRIRNSVKLASIAASLAVTGFNTGRRNVKTIGAWPKEIFPFPGMGKACPNTSYLDEYYLNGTVAVRFPRFRFHQPQGWTAKLTVINDSIAVPLFRVSRADGSGGLSEELAESAVDNSNLRLDVLQGVEVKTGMMPLLGPCYGWRIHPPSLQLTYFPAVVGNISTLESNRWAFAHDKNVTLKVRDLAAPHKVQLPNYQGLIFIVAAFGMAFIWMVTGGFFILFQPLIWWNVRKNRGLPPIVYRYMAKYRGW